MLDEHRPFLGRHTLPPLPQRSAQFHAGLCCQTVSAYTHPAHQHLRVLPLQIRALRVNIQVICMPLHTLLTLR